MKFTIALASAGALLLSGAASASCGSAFCMLDTQWSMQGIQAEPGTRLDLRYEYINQDRVQTGRSRIGLGAIPRDHDEVRTLNRNYVATLDHNFGATWGVTVTAPAVYRAHDHNENDASGAQTPESWRFTELGDVRLLGRYQFPPSESADQRLRQAGLYFGTKLPTGRFHVANGDGQRAERTLQPGTGTTDALLGAFWRESIPLHGLSWFAQGLLQLPLDSREDYRPGRRLSFDAGLRYEATDEIGLLLQANTLFRGRDRGAQAEPEDSGGRSLFLSPGVSYAVTKDLQVYGFYQLPLYQYVNGVQLVASRSVVLGLSVRF